MIIGIKVKMLCIELESEGCYKKGEDIFFTFL